MTPLADKKIDILLVDDREDGLITLEALLGGTSEYHLVKARSGREAISKLDQFDFAMILLDVQMPELDGFETARLIRLDQRYRSLPIIFVTAINKDETYVSRGYEAGAVDYIFKPFDPNVLRSKVAVFAELHRKNFQIREQARQLAERDALQHRAFVQAVELENLRRYRNLADSIPHIVLRASDKGLLEYHNDLWSRMTGLQSHESLGKGWHMAVEPSDLIELQKEMESALLHKSGFETEIRLRGSNGTLRWHWVRSEPELDALGKVMAWLITFTDIEDRKVSARSLEEAQKHAQTANDAKTYFLANMSHEIRTPLNAIMGFTELLLDPEISMQEKLKSVSIVRRNGYQLLKIVDEILDISKVEAGGMVTEKVETKTLDLISEIRSLMSIQAEKKGIGLDFTCNGAIPGLILTDSTRLRQILINIIGNAIKFTQTGKVKLSVGCRKIEGKRHMISFEIADNGVGVDQKVAEKIFEPFSQADASTTRIFGGTGLGLPLSRKLARALGGDVRLLKSSPGEGSTFLVELEVEVPPLATWHERLNLEADLLEWTGPAPTGQSLLGKKILLVEDTEDNQVLIKQFLAPTGAVVEVANNGQEGIEKALNGNFEVVLMDIQMPLVDGYQATKSLRTSGYTKPIIALTAHAMNEEREKSLSQGCNGHLTKPINRSELIDSLSHFV